MKLRIGSRGSDLALAQSRFVGSLLAALPEPVDSDITIIKTSGDLIQNVSLADLGATSDARKGIFTKEIEDALLRNEIDLAVHSYKDLPTQMPPGLVIGAMPKRVVTHDVLVFPAQKKERDRSPFLAPGARVGTSSVRRIAQMAHRFGDLVCTDIRGNVPTRLRKLRDGHYDGIVLAAAGLERLRETGLFDTGEHAGLLEGLVFEPLEPPLFIPAPAQGALAIQCREGDETVLSVVRRLHDEAAAAGVEVERAVLSALDGGCHLPLGADCRREEDTFALSIFLGAEAADNRHGRSFTLKRSGPAADRLSRLVVRELREELPIVLTGRADRMNEVVAELAEDGPAPGRLLHLPLIEIERLPVSAEDRAACRAYLGQEARPLIAVFSVPGAEAFAAMLQEEEPGLPAGLRWAVNGERTAEKIEELFPGADVAFESFDGTGETLARELVRVGVTSVLAVSAERSRPEFAEVLRGAGGRVESLALYRTRPRLPAPEVLRALPSDVFIVFGSPSGVETYLAALQQAGETVGDGARLCAIGPTTAGVIRDAGYVPYVVAARTDYTDFVRELL